MVEFIIADSVWQGLLTSPWSGNQREDRKLGYKTKCPTSNNLLSLAHKCSTISKNIPVAGDNMSKHLSLRQALHIQTPESLLEGNDKETN